MRALEWLASTARSHDATLAHEANINDCDKIVRAALRSASVQREPVGYATQTEHGWVLDGILKTAKLRDGQPLYAASPSSEPETAENPTPESLREMAEFFDSPNRCLPSLLWRAAPGLLFTPGSLLRAIAREYEAALRTQAAEPGREEDG